MAKYIIKRVLLAIVTLFVLVSIVFVLVRLLPGDPFSNPKMTPEIKANLEAYYGLDKPLPVQYVTYMKNVIRGDLGYSMKYEGRTVNRIISESFPFSADLGIRALCFAFFFGIILGIIAALNRGKKLDFFCILIAIIGTSIPDFIMGSLLQYFFGIKWQLLPVAQYTSFKHTILPSIAVGFYTLASVSRLMRSSMLEVVTSDYTKTARAKGLSEFRVTFKHQIRNAITPIITIMGPTVAAVLTGTFVIEALFAIPGMGKYYVDSINMSDYTLVLGMTIFYGAFLVIAILIVDILYGIVDPRIRLSGKKA